MANLLKIITQIDNIFTSIVFVPALIILYKLFTPHKQHSKMFLSIYRLCIVLVIIFLIRSFCAGFIFTEVNYSRFTDNALFPVIKAIFYPGHI